MKEEPQKSRSMVSSLWVNYNMAPAAERCGKFHKRSDVPFRHLIDSLLLDDEVFVPTQDFMVLPVFLDRLGGSSFVELLESGCLKFVRFPGAIGYSGGGAGLMIFGVEYQDGRHRPITASIPEAARAALESVGMFADRTLTNLLEKATIELDVAETFEPIASETYADVQQTPSLRKWFASRSKTFQSLAGVGDREVRIYGGPDINWVEDEIGVLLALATANLELRMAELLSCENVASTSPIQTVINAKVNRHPAGHDAFAPLRELVDIPDIGMGLLSKQLMLPDLLKLRSTPNAAQFRTWFRQHRGDAPSEVAKAYVELLRRVPTAQSWPSRILRYLVTTAAGFVPGYGMVAGPALSAADSFLTDYLFGKRSALIFIDELKAYGHRVSS